MSNNGRDRREPLVDHDGLRRAALARQAPLAAIPDHGSREDSEDRADQPDRRDELEAGMRALAEAIPRTMSEAVARASIEEVPEAARQITTMMVGAIERVSSDSESISQITTDAATGLREEAERVCQAIQDLLSRARYLHELNRATLAAYNHAPRREGVQ